MAYNDIQSVGFLDGCKNVVEINLQGNMIKSLEDKFEVPKLKILILDENPLETVEGVSQAKQLQLLSLRKIQSELHLT